MNHCLRMALAMALLFGLSSLSHLQAQRRSINQRNSTVAPVGRSFVFTNVTIVQTPTKTIKNGTLLIKNGLITALGTEVEIPGEAISIAADSMYVYAGFIDGLSYTGVPRPESSNGRERVNDPGNPSNVQAGIQAGRAVRDVLVPSDKSVSEMRAAGFTAAHIVPRGRMLPGTGAIILLAGDLPEKMILKDKVSLYSQFSTARGVYPSTVIGLMAKWRELYRQARLSKAHEKAYGLNPTAMARPTKDPVLQAFYPVIDQQLPVFFRAEDLSSAYRAMTLQKDLGFPLVIAGLKQGWEISERLKNSGTTVFLSLDLPKNKDEKKKEKDKKEKSEEKADDSATSEEMEALKKRRAESFKQYHSQAANIHQAGVPFGFSTLGVKAKDIHGNLRSMIKHGLDEEIALAALTTQAADMLGLSSIMGTLEVGKIANLMITDKPYFEEEAHIRYVFVEGRKYEFEIKEKKKGDPNAQANALGSWAYQTETPQGSSEGTIVIKGEPDNLSGTITNSLMGEEVDLDNVKLEGNELSMSFNVDAGGQNLSITISGVIEGDTLEGTMTAGEFGSFELTAERKPK